jgi:NADPH:quinone reductase-like Zn-dependent oxidoreductase
MPVNGSSAHARAFWVVAPGSGEIRPETLPPPRADEIVVRALYSGVSRGTEALVFNGLVPPSEYERMRAPFQAGAFPGPVKYGYSSVGIVETPGDLEGRSVFALYPHQTRYVIPRAAVQAIPENVPPARAILAANLETAVNGLWDAAPLVGDRITVIGAGTVGCLVAWLAAAIPGCEVELVDINPERAAIAAALGVSFCAPAGIRGDADLVIHVSGSPEGLTLALGAAAFEATIVEMSWFGATQVTIPLGEAFHVRRLTLRSSQVGHIAPAQRSRWDFRRRIQLALRLLASPVLDALITGETPFDTLPMVMSELARGPRGALCHRISYDHGS